MVPVIQVNSWRRYLFPILFLWQHQTLKSWTCSEELLTMGKLFALIFIQIRKLIFFILSPVKRSYGPLLEILFDNNSSMDDLIL